MQLRVVNGEVVEVGQPQLHARFYEHAKRVAKDRWEPTTYIELKAPGDRSSFSRAATEDDKTIYPQAWEAYQAGIEVQESTGTTLDLLPAKKTAFVLELKAMDINTIEELAALEEPPEEYMEAMWKQAKLFVQLEAAE